MTKVKVKSTFSRLMEFSKHSRNEFIISIFLAILGVAAAMVPYFATANILVELIKGYRRLYCYILWCSIAATGFILKAIFMSLSTTISHTATYASLKDIRLKLVTK